MAMRTPTHELIDAVQPDVEGAHHENRRSGRRAAGWRWALVFGVCAALVGLVWRFAA
jgi:ferric-dicitrate binding protein FerR (iron transport regulator)